MQRDKRCNNNLLEGLNNQYMSVLKNCTANLL